MDLKTRKLVAPLRGKVFTGSLTRLGERLCHKRKPRKSTLFVTRFSVVRLPLQAESKGFGQKGFGKKNLSWCIVVPRGDRGALCFCYLPLSNMHPMPASARDNAGLHDEYRQRVAQFLDDYDTETRDTQCFFCNKWHATARCHNCKAPVCCGVSRPEQGEELQLNVKICAAALLRPRNDFRMDSLDVPVGIMRNMQSGSRTQALICAECEVFLQAVPPTPVTTPH